MISILIYRVANIMLKLFMDRKMKPQSDFLQLLTDWELTTCAGSQFYNQGDYKNAILQFEKALRFAKVGLTSNKQRTTFMKYYTLASMNLAHALNTYQKQPQWERVLSDAHFNMLSMMVDLSEPLTFRQEAKAQAELLLNNLNRYLTSVGKKKVADSLEEEFSRLKITHQTV
ncbi:MAG: hypothetical protein ACJAYV_002654 [Oleispira sp.]|jgi:hypothetical protein